MSDNSRSGQAQDTILELSVPVERRYLELYRAALNGNWKPNFKELTVSTVISQREETALHIAAAANNTDFAKQLVDMMSKTDLAQQNFNSNTAFFFVAISGNVELAKAMMKKNSDLATIRGGAEHKLLPLYMAALYGHREMVLYLYKETRDKLDGKLEKEDGIKVFIALLKWNLYDVALKLLGDQPDDYQDFFACLTSDQIEMVLDLLARRPQMYSRFADESEQGIWNRCIKIWESTRIKTQRRMKSAERDPIGQRAEQRREVPAIISPRSFSPRSMKKEAPLPLVRYILKKFSGNNVDQNKTSEHQELLVKRLRKEVLKSGIVESQEYFKKLIFVAAKQGNVELLTGLIHSYPDLIWEKDDNNRSIFHIAVLQRHEDIFKLIHEIGSIKYLIATYKDEERNNMLHMAGKLAPLDRLKIVPGAALQLQRELLWFEEVKKIMQPQEVEAENMQPQKANRQPQEAEAQNRKCQTPGETPGALFTKEHSNLMKEGEKWMRETANSCMLVATLIATVVFAAAFTVPGGNKDQTGIPIFLESISFIIFAVSDAISLLFSCFSILVFLSILTSRYTEKDFLWSLPNKLIIGLATLFISIAAMMAAFCATFYIFFNHGLYRFVIVIVLAEIAFVPVILFFWLHLRLCRDIILLTYRSRSMFHPSKPTLFPKKD